MIQVTILIIVIIVGNYDGVAVSQERYSSPQSCQVAAKAVTDMNMNARVKTACVPL